MVGSGSISVTFLAKDCRLSADAPLLSPSNHRCPGRTACHHYCAGCFLPLDGHNPTTIPIEYLYGYAVTEPGSARRAISTCGRESHIAHSALISPAVVSSAGRWSCRSRWVLVSAACTVTFIAARTVPDPSLTGTATERTPGASSSSASAQPRALISASSSRSGPAWRPIYGGSPDRLGWASTAATWSGGSAASSTLPCEVCTAGNRVPMSTRSAISLGTETRAT